ncbi:MAG: DUF5058 family protein [Lachnospiraceae bacterium]|nr:DUF5058 family protein [Lachnospiraceae bacterium]
MTVIQALNSTPLYLICGGIVLFVALVCVFFMIRAYRQGIAIGMDKTKLKRTITSSATFTILPSVGILLGVIALSGSLGTPLPWLRLSVIGALHYETQVAEAAAEVVGLPGLSMSSMTFEAFVNIALLMSFCIIWGMLLSIFFTKKYLGKFKGSGKTGSAVAGFGDTAMTAMFIGLVSAYVASYIGTFVSGNGVFTFTGSLMPLVVSVVAGAVMAGFIFLAEKKKATWVESFSIAGSMILAMAAAVFLNAVL